MDARGLSNDASGGGPVARGGPQRIPRPADARPGPGAWWSQPGARTPRSVTLDAVRAAFAGDPSPEAGSAEPPERTSASEVRHQVDLPTRDPRPAAVLCAVFDDDGQAAVVLTRRSQRLRSHTGEVSFPGGRIDPGETAVQAALREAQEEVGLDPAAIEIVASLHPLATYSSRAAITPFVGVLGRRPELHPNPAEVERAFTVTLAELVADGAYHDELWSPPGEPRSRLPVHFFELPGETVWGATARMLRDLLDRVLPAPQFRSD